MTDSPRRAVDSPPARSGADQGIALLLICLGMTLSILFALQSTGAYQLDDLGHYAMARWSWTYPQYLLHEWGRPGFTVLYAIPARFGWVAARLLTTVICALTAWYTFAIARRIRIPHPWITVLLLYGQPLFFQLSFATLTETLLALILCIAVDLAQRGRWSASSAVLALALITRHEAVLFAPLWAWVAWKNRVSLWRLTPIVWAFVVQHLLSPWSPSETILHRWLHAKPTDFYGHGGWLSMLCRSLEAWGPAVGVLAFCGIPKTRSRPNGDLVVGTFLIYFGAHTVIWAVGLFGGGGLPRYLVPVAPFVAICAAAALDELLAAPDAARARLAAILGAILVVVVIAVEIQVRSQAVPFYVPYSHHVVWLMRATVVAVLICCTMAFLRAHDIREIGRRRHDALAMAVAILVLAQLVAWNYIVKIAGPLPQERIARQALEWIARNGYADRPLFYADLCIAHFRDEIQPPVPELLCDRVAKAPGGSLVLWDQFYSEQGWNKLSRAALDQSPSFRLIYESAPIAHSPEAKIRLYEKLGPSKP